MHHFDPQAGEHALNVKPRKLAVIAAAMVLRWVRKGFIMEFPKIVLSKINVSRYL